MGIKNGVTEMEGIAASNNFAIGDDGAVIDKGPPPDVAPEHAEAAAEERKQVAAERADRVRQVIQSADDVDNDFCVVLDLSAAWAISGSWPYGSLMLMVASSPSLGKRTVSWVMSNSSLQGAGRPSHPRQLARPARTTHPGDRGQAR